MATVADVGPTGRVVADNVKRFRQARGLSLRGLESALREAGRPIHPAGLHRLERGERRVDIDELAALAKVFGMPMSRLLAEDESYDIILEAVRAVGAAFRHLAVSGVLNASA